MVKEAEQNPGQKGSFFALKKSILSHPWKIIVFFGIVQTMVWLITTQAVLTNGNFLREAKLRHITELFIASCMFFVFLTLFNAMPYGYLVLPQRKMKPDPEPDLLYMFCNLPNELIFVCDYDSIPFAELDTETRSFKLKAKNVFLKTADDF